MVKEPVTEEVKETKAVNEDSKTETEESKAEAEKSEAETETVHVFKNMKENVAKEEKQEEQKEAADEFKKIIVIVNQKPIVMRGKEKYTFVDIFDYINFDTSKMRGAGIATLVNGKDAQYTQELYNGDKIEVYWK